MIISIHNIYIYYIYIYNIYIYIHIYICIYKHTYSKYIYIFGMDEGLEFLFGDPPRMKALMHLTKPSEYSTRIHTFEGTPPLLSG